METLFDDFEPEKNKSSPKRKRPPENWTERIVRQATADLKRSPPEPRPLRPRPKPVPYPYAPLQSMGERTAPCVRCGLVTSDWMSYDGKTGLCKCNNCFQPDRQKALEQYAEAVQRMLHQPEAKSVSSPQ